VGDSENIGERPLGKQPVGRTRRRWDNNIEMSIRNIAYENVK
jgi:hypothetical protein